MVNTSPELRHSWGAYYEQTHVEPKIDVVLGFVVLLWHLTIAIPVHSSLPFHPDEIFPELINFLTRRRQRIANNNVAVG